MQLNKRRYSGDLMLKQFSRMWCQNCQIVQRSWEGKASWWRILRRFCSATTRPLEGKTDGFDIIITKTRGACVITGFWTNQSVTCTSSVFAWLHATCISTACIHIHHSSWLIAQLIKLSKILHGLDAGYAVAYTAYPVDPPLQTRRAISSLNLLRLL